MTCRACWRIIVGALLLLFPPSAEAGEITRATIEQKIAKRQSPLDLSNTDLSGVDLSGLDLRGADFFSSRLADANLKGANVSSANFTRSDLQHADFSRANLSGATLYAALLEGANFSGADLTRARIIGGGKGVKFSKAKLVDEDLGADPANQGMVPVRAELP